MKFTWRNRESALKRIVVRMTCTITNIEEAINATLHTADQQPDGSSKFRYCNHPHLISKAVRGKLEADTLQVINYGHRTHK